MVKILMQSYSSLFHIHLYFPYRLSIKFLIPVNSFTFVTALRYIRERERYNCVQNTIKVVLGKLFNLYLYIFDPLKNLVDSFTFVTAKRFSLVQRYCHILLHSIYYILHKLASPTGYPASDYPTAFFSFCIIHVNRLFLLHAKAAAAEAAAVRVGLKLSYCSVVIPCDNIIEMPNVSRTTRRSPNQSRTVIRFKRQ